MDNYRMYYLTPAREWEQALPLGNGRIGAMIYGGVYGEQIQLNEESIWYGADTDRVNPDARASLDTVRELLDNGQIQKAQQLMGLAMAGCPDSSYPYQTLGNLYIRFGGGYAASAANCAAYEELDYKKMNYVRELDLKNAISRVSYTVDGVTCFREMFISKPYDTFVIKLSADKPASLDFTAKLERYRFCDGVCKWGNDGIALYANQGRGAIAFAFGIRLKHKGGKASLIGERICVTGADEAVLYITASTTYQIPAPFQDKYISDWERTNREKLVNYTGNKNDIKNNVENNNTDIPQWLKREKNLSTAIRDMLLDDMRNITDKAMSCEYEALKESHIKDYTALFDSMRLDISGGNDMESLPVDERLKNVQAGKTDVGLAAMMFNFGRYLLISCSRKGTLAATLQGLWNKDYLPPWDSKYTININTQMNYWPAECCNLSECHMPLFELINKMRAGGRRTAREMYGCRGFVAHHNTNIYGDTAPQDLWYPGTFWTMGAAWLCTHLWTHYIYTLDMEFLIQAFPVMAECALFFVDFLVERDGYLVTSPSVSPENTYVLSSGEKGSVCVGAVMDNQILRDLFTDCIQAYRILGKELTDSISIPGADNMDALISDIQYSLSKLAPTRISDDGRILEWNKDYGEAEPGHRHISHLYGLFPSGQINVDDTPELARAARNTLEYRLSNGGGHTGWSRAWIINHYARLRDPQKAWENITRLMDSSTYPNLFDKHPPFQIDGNFGLTAAIANMLVESSMNKAVVLPALPDEWKNGSVEGLCLVGNGRISISWESHRLTALFITANEIPESEYIPDTDEALGLNNTFSIDVIYGKRSVSISLERGCTSGNLAQSLLDISE